MQVVVDGLLTAYELSGTGKTVVLLHGWGDRASGFKILQEGLSQHFTVITPDLPGFGASSPPGSPWDLTDYADFLAHFLQKIDAENIYAFVGHSNGGAIALRGLGSGVLQAEKLVLLASAGIRGTYEGRNKALRLVVKTGKALTLPLPAATKRKLRRKVYDTVGSDMLVAEHLQETFKKVVADDVQADAAKVRLPVLLVYGEDDRAAPVRYGEKFHELMSNSILEILPGAGHFVYLDRPQDVIQLIQEFL
jgi:pimeloyl-ACP methyl ester carboxylesterase